ncbi:hypothetical protein [Shewanella sp. OMA3-2]|uniref:hypothetical protein n=1 Tax=Shewanella sp. OMA3-2 TaxID=2908650 RepID=UPI001F302BC3|nr:hypothetical protein [Shewanella sp. OMA3-2]UJF22818.1 hypothetical protein L0B17_05375 [Shewanella sp. OMA3-2]
MNSKNSALIYVAIVLLLSLSACGGASSYIAPVADNHQDEVDVERPTSNLPIPDNRFANEYKILFFGNSHVSGQPSLINRLIQVGNNNSQVTTFNAGGGFLDDAASQKRREDLLTTEPWTHVILQGQKYSQSGTVNYPTLPAQVWIAKAKGKSITPILFPEHPQIGRDEEARQVHQLHSSIVAVQQSCIAPIGLAWNKVLMISPKLRLHMADGNHASLMGNLLTALVFYEVITGHSADLLPYIADIAVDEPTQQLLGQIASETIQANVPCTFG